MFSFRRSRIDETAMDGQPPDALFEPLRDAIRPPATERSGGQDKTTPALPASVAGSHTHLRALGLSLNATWMQVDEAHRRLVSDLTPGADACHRKVALAEEFLAEVNQAYAALRALAVA